MVKQRCLHCYRYTYTFRFGYRHDPLFLEFSSCHDVVIFVSGSKSSNGKALYEVCLKAKLAQQNYSELIARRKPTVKLR